MTCIGRQLNATIRFLGYRPQQNLGAKIYLCSTTSQLNGNFESQFLWRGTWYKQSGNGVASYEGSPTSSPNFTNFGPLTAKNRTGVFTDPPKSSSAWWRRTSRWPVLRRANISSVCFVAFETWNLLFIRVLPFTTLVFTRTWLRYVPVTGICYRKSVCRLSVCLSSLMLVRRTGVEYFGNIFFATVYLAILWPPCKILRGR